MSQIKLLLDIIADVRSLGESLQAYADTLAANGTAINPDDFEEIYDPDTDELQEDSPKKQPSTPEPPKEVTLPEVRVVLAEKSRAGYTDEVKQLLMKHGAEKLSGIDPAEYAALKEEAEKLGS